MKKKLVIIIPIYHPETNWGNIVENNINSICELYHSQFTLSLILVDDGNDNILYDFNSIRDKLEVTILKNNKNLGKGASIRNGLQIAEADIYLYTDVDFPYTFQSLQQIISEIENGYDIAISKRGYDYLSSIKPLRKAISRLLHTVIKNCFQLHNTDTQGGLKAFNTIGKQTLLQTKIDRYLFDLEWIILSEHKKLKIKSVICNIKEGYFQKPTSFAVLRYEGIDMIQLFILKLKLIFF